MHSFVKGWAKKHIESHFLHKATRKAIVKPLRRNVNKDKNLLIFCMQKIICLICHLYKFRQLHVKNSQTKKPQVVHWIFQWTPGVSRRPLYLLASAWWRSVRRCTRCWWRWRWCCRWNRTWVQRGHRTGTRSRNQTRAPPLPWLGRCRDGPPCWPSSGRGRRRWNSPAWAPHPQEGKALMGARRILRRK